MRITSPTAAVITGPLRWPSEAKRIPTRCLVPLCGGWVAVDAPTTDHPLTDATCQFCGRSAVSLVHDGYRSSRERADAAGAYKPSRRGRPVGAKQAGGSVQNRLIVQLRRNGPAHIEYLADTLAVSVAQIRNAVMHARGQGHEITQRGGVYSLESGR